LQIEAATKQKGQIQDWSLIGLDQPELHSSSQNTTNGDKTSESNYCQKLSELNSILSSLLATQESEW
jgi:hypothetical protein